MTNDCPCFPPQAVTFTGQSTVRHPRAVPFALLISLPVYLLFRALWPIDPQFPLDEGIRIVTSFVVPMLPTLLIYPLISIIMTRALSRSVPISWKRISDVARDGREVAILIYSSSVTLSQRLVVMAESEDDARALASTLASGATAAQ